MAKKSIVCIGAALVDEIYRCSDQPQTETSNPATFGRFAGGVVRNVAHHLGLLGHPVQLVSHFGNDDPGRWLMNECRKAHIQLDFAHVSDSPTGRYAAILSPEGSLFTAASVSHLEAEITPALLESLSPQLASALLLVIDCNLSEESLAWLISYARHAVVPIILEPVSVPKALRLKALNLRGTLLITPGEAEQKAIFNDEPVSSKGIQNVWVRRGKLGSVLYHHHEITRFPAPGVTVADTTGAGDAALAGWIHAWHSGKNPVDCVRYGHALAALILQTQGAVRADLTPSLLESTLEILH